MNMIDNLLVEEAISNRNSEDAIIELRTKIDTAYDRIENGTGRAVGNSVGRHTNYIQPTENGYAGLDAPLG